MSMSTISVFPSRMSRYIPSIPTVTWRSSFGPDLCNWSHPAPTEPVVWIWWFGIPWEKFVSWTICMYWRGLVIRTWSQSWSNFENIDRNSFSNLGRFVIKEEDSLSDPRFPTIFHCRTHCLLYCWCRDVDRWFRWWGVGPITKDRSEGRPSGYTVVILLFLTLLYIYVG